MPTPLQPYSREDFASPTEACDLVMKGGVTSGIVYPYAVLELARRYRFVSIGGTSAGAVAAALTAAAEYGRSVRGDPDSFLRLQRICDELPMRLESLFQPAPRYAPLLAALLQASRRTTLLGRLGAVIVAFWPSLAAGALAGGLVLALLQAGFAGILLGTLVGAVVGVLAHGSAMVAALPRSGYGICPGLTQRSAKEPALTDWLHAAIQEVAFGRADHPEPLTFGHLTGAGGGTSSIELRVITTNLSMRRPHVLPRLDLSMRFDPQEWRALFPASVVDHMLGRGGGAPSTSWREEPHLRPVPAPRDLPVVVAARMSLSFPLLIAAVPLYVRDIVSGSWAKFTGGERITHVRRVWFSDGGISSNFPVHLFDALIPSRPTFALSLDALPPDAREDGERVLIPNHARHGAHLPVHLIEGVLGFVMSLFWSAKDWQDNLLATLPGQRERIARVLLAPSEGGLNLSMSPDVSRRLMGYGRIVGTSFANGALDFDEHRWRRTLVTYAQLETALVRFSEVWGPGQFGPWLAQYQPKSYTKLTISERSSLQDRLEQVAVTGSAFAPKINEAKLPRPKGRLRIGPDV